MSELVYSFARRSIQAVFDNEPLPHGVRSWILDRNFYVADVGTRDRIQLSNVSLNEFAAYQLFDFARFALSSLETLVGCHPQPGKPRALGWPLLKSYYAGFFGAHALLRALGRGVIRLDGEQARALTELAQLSAVPFRIDKGTYYYELIQNTDLTFSIVLQRLDEQGGAHEAFWRTFNHFLNETSKDIATRNEPNANLVVGRISELQQVMNFRSLSGSWLSSTRNEINYQHLFGVWFPYDVDQHVTSYAKRLGYRSIEHLRLDYSYRKEPIQAFSAASLFIGSWAFELSNLLVGPASGRDSSFARDWRRLAKDIDVAI